MVYSFSRGLEDRFFRRLGIVAIVGTLAFLPAIALAKSAGDFVVRMRAIGVIPDEGGAANDGTIITVFHKTERTRNKKNKQHPIIH